MNEVKSINHQVKPFLRWAGGKRWLVKHLESLIGELDYNNYHEPFLGGGSIFLAVKPSRKSFLSDLNNELINTYKALKKDPNSIIKELNTFENTQEFYYKTRSENYENPYKEAARFIYLNQTSFNGIYRVNLKGQYNVPYGFRTKNFIEPEILKSFSKRLKKVKLYTSDFDIVKKNITENDLVFLDPPYTTSHNLNGFIKYNQKIFSLEDQYRLSELIDFIKEKNAFYILTNAAHDKIKEIFTKDDTLMIKNRASLIGGINAARGKTSEYLFTNITQND